MDNYPSNSNRAREAQAAGPKKKPSEAERPKVKRVVTGEVQLRKKPLFSRFMVNMFGGDDARSVWSHVSSDVLIPAARDAIADGVITAVEQKLYGGSRGGRRSSGSSSRGGGPNVNYSRFSSSPTRNMGHRPDPREDPRPRLSREARSAHRLDEIILDTRREGEEVLDQLFNLVDQYGTASLNDLYDMLGETPDYASDRYGWDGVESLHGATVRHTRRGYLLDIPSPQPL